MFISKGLSIARYEKFPFIENLPALIVFNLFHVQMTRYIVQPVNLVLVRRSPARVPEALLQVKRRNRLVKKSYLYVVYLPKRNFIGRD